MTEQEHLNSMAPAGQLLNYQTEVGRLKEGARWGYACWKPNFQTTIQRAIESCEASVHAVSDHFRGVTKMVEPGNNRRAAP